MGPPDGQDSCACSSCLEEQIVAIPLLMELKCAEIFSLTPLLKGTKTHPLFHLFTLSVSETMGQLDR